VAVSDSLVTPRRQQRNTPKTTFLSEFTAVKPVVVAPETVGGQCLAWPLRAAGGTRRLSVSDPLSLED